MMSQEQEVVLHGQQVTFPGVSLKELLFQAMNNRSQEEFCAVDVETGDRLTIRQLAEGCQSLGHQLIDSCPIVSSRRVGISLDVSFHSIIAVITCVINDICYVPLEPSLPPKRMSQIASHSGLDTIITASDEPAFNDETTKGYNWINVTRRGHGLKNGMNGSLKHEEKRTEDIFAIYYTSGSTGEPKGVLMSTSSVLNRLNWSWKRFPFQEGEVATMRTSIGFVDSICELLSPFVKRVTIAVVTKSVLLNPQLFIQSINHFKISRIILVPSLLKLLLDGIKSLKQPNLSTIKYVITSGEDLPPSLAREFFSWFKSPQASLLNLYGSTEVMADVTCQEFKTLEDVSKYCCGGHVSIGLPIDNSSILVSDIDENGIGNLIITGVAVTLGYYEPNNNYPTVATNKFFNHPKYGPSFNTGDRAKVCQLNPTVRVLVSMGRSDTQIKINGQRIDLVEITQTLVSQYEVSPVVVFDKQCGKILAFFNHDDYHRMMNIGSLLAKVLPRCALPELVNIGLNPFPSLQPSGKIDRKLLLELYHRQQKMKSSISIDCSKIFVRSNSLDNVSLNKLKALLKIMKEAGILYHPTSVSELKRRNFFQAGGTSLNAVYVVAKLKSRGFHVTIGDFLQTTNFMDLLEKISKTEPFHSPFTSCASFDERYKYISMAHEDKDYVAGFVSQNFIRAERIAFCLHQNDPILREILHQDFMLFIKAIFSGCVKSSCSYLVLEKQSQKVVGAFLAIDESDIPQDQYYEYQHENWAVMAIIHLLNHLEKPIVDSLKFEHKRILMSMLMCVDLDYVQSYSDRVLLMFEMEKKIIESSIRHSFEVVATTNSSPVTRDACEILGYDVQGTVLMNKYVDYHTGRNPFVASAQDVIKTAVKILD